MDFDFISDVWRIQPRNNSLHYYHTFDFTHIKSEGLKEQIKGFFRQQLLLGSRAISTLYIYCYSLKHFTIFLEEYKFNLNSFDELTYQIVIQFAFYIKNTVKSSGRRVTIYAALKTLVLQGQLLNLKGYPETDIFPEASSRIFGHADTLKSQEISQEVLVQIDEALKIEDDIYVKTLIVIAKNTGLRVSEILTLKERSVLPDFLGSPLLNTYSIKNDKERIIPITKGVADAINELEIFTASLRDDENKWLFMYRYQSGKIGLLHQKQARILIADFIKKHQIKGMDNNLTKFTPHSFRHTIGTEMLNNGASAQVVKELLGHESMHSTSLYAQIRDNTLDAEYRKIGFVGVTAPVLSEETLEVPISPKTIAMGALPDGICKRAFEGERSCKSFNKCLLCVKFITTPEYLNIHREHLARIREDRKIYMEEMYICNHEKVDRIEAALIEIIRQLEEM